MSRPRYVNELLFVCLFTFIIISSAFVGLSVHWGFFEFVFNGNSENTLGAQPIYEVYQDTSYPCTLSGCNISGSITTNPYSYFYVETDREGTYYTYRVSGNDLNHFNVVSSVDKLPLYPQDYHSPHVINGEIQLIEVKGTCSSHVIIFGVYSLKPGPFTLHFKGYALEPSNQPCGLMSFPFLICIIIGTAGGIMWVMWLFFWIFYSRTKTGSSHEEERGLLGDLPYGI
eukprot:TRINITY_DN12981_c0_g1_i1.p1 TRINITY_DN12981_c0_g1~~TRINITY_DN12981_c0_g1_i1.p1  ORF type:complete len:228 (-),score=16.01 TRINITY_DN12981_c0_g1_i1:106-789(-)